MFWNIDYSCPSASIMKILKNKDQNNMVRYLRGDHNGQISNNLVSLLSWINREEDEGYYGV